ncbi:hypothetical protein G3I32_20530 [Streptomyces coelicoflavus]|uniref:Uncharacterized protein n=1 Tax=Streptomyces coelicoflavus TaxID=285562 RepID=A0A7K3PMM5_9ACTN|nr:hypothetical protein [Streptomyces coelicoflavus]NEB11193.1 hypothetical protein [Streptomyces coelicoflavus]
MTTGPHQASGGLIRRRFRRPARHRTTEHQHQYQYQHQYQHSEEHRP